MYAFNYSAKRQLFIFFNIPVTSDGLIHNFVRVLLLSITVVENGYFSQFSTVKLLRIIKK